MHHELELYCKGCGGTLGGTILTGKHGSTEVRIKPCITCGEEEFEKGVNGGFDDGHRVGLVKGFTEGFEWGQLIGEQRIRDIATIPIGEA